MSADGYSACPACVSRATGKPVEELTIDELNHAGKVGVNEEGLHKYYETYIDVGHVTVTYEAVCWDCNYEIKPFTYRHRIT